MTCRLLLQPQHPARQERLLPHTIVLALLACLLRIVECFSYSFGYDTCLWGPIVSSYMKQIDRRSFVVASIPHGRVLRR